MARADLPASNRGLFASTAGRRTLFAALYFSEGAPIGFLWWALPTRLRDAGVALEEITLLTALLTVPWTLKFLWAPVVDACRSRRWTRRSWVLAAQLAMGLALLPVLSLDLAAAFDALRWLLLAHAVAAATQDVAIDALAVATVPKAERGGLNGWMQAGMLAGRSLFGGGALWLAAALALSDAALFVLLIAAVWSSLGLLALAGPLPPSAAPPPTRVSAAFGELVGHLRRAMRERRTWAGLAFAGVAGVGFEAVGGLAGPFLVDRGVGQLVIGRFFTLAAAPAMIAGALAGGRLADGRDRRRTVAACLVGLAVAIAGLAVVATASVDVLFPAFGLVYVAIGAFTAASYALFMDCTDPALGATQFTAYMAMTNACEAWAVLVAGRLVPIWGYPTVFALMAGASLLALPLLSMMNETRSAPAFPGGKHRA